jgi:hypothetical protein
MKSREILVTYCRQEISPWVSNDSLLQSTMGQPPRMPLELALN